MEIGQDFVKKLGFSFGIWVNRRLRGRGVGPGLLVVRRKTEIPKRTRLTKDICLSMYESEGKRVNRTRVPSTYDSLTTIVLNPPEKLLRSDRSLTSDKRKP